MATAPKTLRLVPPQQPRLLAAPVEYDAQYQEQYSNALRLYFNQSQNFLELFTSRTGGSFMQFPFGVFNATTAQIPVAINTAYGVTFNNTVLSTSLTIGSPTSRVITNIAGVYNFAFSLQLDSTSVAANAYIWARVDGVDVPNSARKVTVQSSATETVVSGNFVLDMSTDQYFELMYSVDDTAVQISTFAAAAPVPAVPAATLTVTFVSALLT
jgi:hypothetical protein